jgi:TorA maturation chaperone TorD
MSDYDPDQATARADLCRFLSACYYEPAIEFSEEQLFDNMLIAAKRVHPDLVEHARKLGEAFAAKDLQTLLVDYTRLFLGPMEALAKPYEASWRAATEQTESNPPPAVLDIYSEGGFEVDAGFMELPDHVAVELEFLYLLNFNANHATQLGKLDAVAEAQALKQRFLTEHLGAWIVQFSAAITAGAGTDFYRELAVLTERFVRMESGLPSIH